MTAGNISILETSVDTAPGPKEKVDALNRFAFEIRNNDTRRSIQLCKEAQAISREVNYAEGNATALANEAFCYVQISDYELSLEKSYEALNIFETLKNEKGIALSCYNICLVYQRLSNYHMALDNITRALDIQRKQNDPGETARCLMQLGFIYYLLNDHATALDIYEESLQLNRSLGNKAGEAAILMGLGQTYLEMKQYEKSCGYLMESMSIREAIGDRRGYAAVMNAYVSYCCATGRYDEAEQYATRGIEYAKELGDRMGTVRFTKDLAAVKQAQHKTDEAEKLLFDTLHAAETLGLKMAIAPVHQSLYEIYKGKGDYRKALEHHEDFLRAKEELMTMDAAMKAKSIQFAGKIENAQKEAEISRLKNVELKNAYDEIAEKNKAITDSIAYARRIQQAKLPEKDAIVTLFPDSFVLFKPKDIVSGDFYFFYRNGTQVFIAAADCTGHGVPGAFMSIIGSEKLNDALAHSNDPSEVLLLLNKGIKQSLRQSDDDDSTRDGMDIALCAVDTETHTVKYAGANRPLWILKRGATEIEVIKATKKAIGGRTSDDQQFDLHEVQLQQGDMFYVFSDGYADTFNGESGKKLTTKRFRQFLPGISQLPMREQEKALDQFIEEWKSGTEQVDDILVIGVRL